MVMIFQGSTLVKCVRMSHGDYDLTNEDDIKLYLENIETEYSYQCLSEKDPGGKWFIGLYNLSNQLF